MKLRIELEFARGNDEFIRGQLQEFINYWRFDDQRPLEIRGLPQYFFRDYNGDTNGKATITDE